MHVLLQYTTNKQLLIRDDTIAVPCDSQLWEIKYNTSQECKVVVCAAHLVWTSTQTDTSEL